MFNFVRSLRLLFRKAKLYGFKQSLIFAVSASKIILYNQLIKNSFSQCSEDLIIDKLLNYKKDGFYLDIGAYDPKWFSNTNRFYKKGWHGINIEPNSIRYQKFLKSRSKDINLNIGISTKNSNLKFYLFQPDTISTFSDKEAKIYQKLGFKLIDTQYVKVKRLDFIFNKYFKKEIVDFMTIDTEGGELKVLKSNNWNKFRPKIICVESFSFKTPIKDRKERLELRRFLTSKDYKPVFQNSTNIIYLDNR